MALLNVENVDAFYGDSQVLFNVSMEVREQEVVALLGRNGVGKSTTLKAITGLNPAKRGRIIFKGIDITHMRPDQISRLGIGYVPEDRRLFPDLTVAENLRVAEIGTQHPEGTKEVLDIFPLLKRYLGTKARNLSGGEQKMLSMARGMIGRKELLILDEPTEGLAPSIVASIREALLKIKDLKRGIILVESANTPLALEICDRAYIMVHGSIVFEGDPWQVRESKDVQKFLTVAH
ncbi:MAG: ABC transporter ATP-binding protein [Candidatus Bathyarchaeia archaeon]|nr:ABC transporter ATP-binding protein [Candidatus Bathyarchaeota archaeon]